MLSSRAELCYTFLDEARDPALVEAYLAMLAPEELEQHGRFAFPELKHEYLLTRALCRTTLSRYADVAPAAWRFRKNRYGRPEIDGGAAPGLRFNLSNTRGLVACLVAEGMEVGVDVEDTARRGETVAIADRFFAEAEVRALSALPVAEQRGRFFEYWTLKESYIKARGMGLALPLDEFAFCIGAPIRIAFSSAIVDDPASWQFALYRPSERHMMAVALQRGARPDAMIELRRVVPLA